MQRAQEKFSSFKYHFLYESFLGYVECSKVVYIHGQLLLICTLVKLRREVESKVLQQLILGQGTFRTFSLLDLIPPDHENYSAISGNQHYIRHTNNLHVVF